MASHTEGPPIFPDDWFRPESGEPTQQAPATPETPPVAPEPNLAPANPGDNLLPIDEFDDYEDPFDQVLIHQVPLPRSTPPQASPIPPMPSAAPRTPAPANRASTAASTSPASATTRRRIGKMLSFNLIDSDEARELGTDIVDEIKIAAAGVHRTYRALHARRHERTERKKTEENEAIADILSSNVVGQTDARYIRDQGVSRKLAKKIAEQNLAAGAAKSMAQIRRYPNKSGRIYVSRSQGGMDALRVAPSFLNPVANGRRLTQKMASGRINELYNDDVTTYGKKLAGQRRDARLHYVRTGELLAIAESRPHYTGDKNKTAKGRPSFVIAHDAVFGQPEAPDVKRMHGKDPGIAKQIAHHDRDREQVPVMRNGAIVYDAAGNMEMKTGTDAEIYLHKRRTKNERKARRAADKAELHRDAIDESRDNDDDRIERLTDRRRPLIPRPVNTRSRTRNFINRQHNIAVRRFKPRYYGNLTNPRP